MVDGVKKEGVSVLDKISKESKDNSKVKEEEMGTNHSAQTIVLTILAVIAIVGGLTLVLNGGITGGYIGTLGAATTTLADVPVGDSGTTTTTSVQEASGNSEDGSSNEGEAGEGSIPLPESETTANNQGDNQNSESNSNDDSTSRTIPTVDTSRTNDPIAFELEFSNIPEIDATASISDISFIASNLGSSVRINGDLLEAKSKVTIDLTDFVGRFKVNAHTTTLEGTISEIHLNGVSILSESEIEIEIDALRYDTITTDDISFSYMYFPAGEGNLKVIDRLTYELEGDAIDLYDFYGEMTLSSNEGYPVTLVGEAESLESSSNILQLGVQ